jgi:putative transferase (TIGR04331 family)
MISFLEKLLLKLPVREKVFFSTSYFDILSLVRISIKLRQLPLLHSEFDEILRSSNLEVLNLNLSSIRNESLNMQCNNNFEEFVSSNILNQIPMLILEGFAGLLKNVKRIKTDASLIFSANNHMSNIFFQTWTAEKINEGARFISSAHGGAIPDRYSMFKHEELISFKKTTWHIPCFDNHVQLPPNKFIKRNRKANFGNNLLLVGFEFFIYSYRCQSGPQSSLYFEEYNKNLKFCRLLNKEPFKMLKIKPHKHNVDSGWNTHQRYIDDLSIEKISSEKFLTQPILSSKLIVCTYPQTALFESMLSGVPTILLYLEKYWETESEFDDLIECMKNAEIIFSDSKVAANHVNTLWNNPIDWWNSEKVLSAREYFHEKCGKSSPDWLNEWSSFFKHEVRKLEEFDLS